MLSTSIPSGQSTHPKLATVEQQIGILQSEIAQNENLKSSRHWRENGETIAGYQNALPTKNALNDSSQSFITSITSDICDTPTSLENAATTCYNELFTSEPTDSESIFTLLETIPSSYEYSINPGEMSTLTSPFSISDLHSVASRKSKHSSPGMDGLPYPILNLLFHHHLIEPLALQVYNDPLQHSLFLSSWHNSCITLLPKIGDLLSLSNYRPIALIGTDAKSFTRLLNSRLMPFLSSRICLSVLLVNEVYSFNLPSYMLNNMDPLLQAFASINKKPMIG